MNPEPQPLQIHRPKYTVLQPSRYGWHCCMVNDMQTAAVMFQGEACPVEADFLCSLLSPGDFVVDAGASVGSLSMAFASAIGQKGKVFAMEPQALSYQCLVANVVTNSLSHIISPLQVAVGNDNGQINVPVLDAFDPNHGGCSLLDKTDRKLMPVPLITIDSIGLPACKLIKIDVEGMEPEALRGAYRTIAKCRPFLWVEHLDYIPWRNDTKGPLLEIFEEHDYEAWKISTPSYSPTNTRRNDQNPFGEGIGDQNVLAVPKGVEMMNLSPKLVALGAVPFK